MFKRIASVAILFMLILSFTVGSVGSATAYQTCASVTVVDKPSDWFPGPMVMAPLAMGIATDRLSESPPGFGYTTMVIEMGSIEFEPPLPRGDGSLQGQIFTTEDAVILTGNYIMSHPEKGALVGNMKVYKSGSPVPKTFPVRWEASGAHEHGKPEYFTHARINMSEVDPYGTPGFVEFSSSIVLDEAKLNGSYVIVNNSGVYTSEIAAGDDNWHTLTVGEAIESMDVDLNWEDNSSDLRLMIYTPDGKVLGPYTDSSDGTTDGRIYLNISNTEGLAAGEWYLKVTDTDKVGNTDYYVKTY